MEVRPDSRPKGRTSGNILVKVRYSDLAALFGKSTSTMKQWNQADIFDAYDLESICELYHEKKQLGKV